MFGFFSLFDFFFLFSVSSMVYGLYHHRINFTMIKYIITIIKCLDESFEYIWNKICWNMHKMCEVLILISMYVNCFVTFDKRNAHSKSNNALMHFFWDWNRKTQFPTEREREWAKDLIYDFRLVKDELIKIVLLEKRNGVGSKCVSVRVFVCDIWFLTWIVAVACSDDINQCIS